MAPFDPGGGALRSQPAFPVLHGNVGVSGFQPGSFTPILGGVSDRLILEVFIRWLQPVFHVVFVKS